MHALHVLGRLPNGGVAIIGSRTPPLEAVTFAYDLARRIGKPVISGLAPGIDTAAHRGALAGGLATVAFVGYGFGRTDPPENVELERIIVERGGAIATVRPPGEAVTPRARIDRNRLQAQNADAVVLVCSEIDGGALHTMRFARELGRRRFAVEPPESRRDCPEWAGNLQALAEGAISIPLDVDEALEIIHASTTG